MARDYNKKAGKRGKKSFVIPPKILIFVEGRNTEPSYLGLLKSRSTRIIPLKIVPGKGIGSCMKFVEDATGYYNALNQRIREKYSQVWLMFDCDGHADFEEAVRLARGRGFKVAFSNMCIEYWFLLHFINHNGSAIPQKNNSHSQAHIDEIERCIDKYNKDNPNNIEIKPYDINSKKVEEDFFDLMVSINKDTKRPRIIDAYCCAKRIHEKKKQNGAEFTESVTTIYELLNCMGVVKEENGKMALNIS